MESNTLFSSIFRFSFGGQHSAREQYIDPKRPITRKEDRGTLLPDGPTVYRTPLNGVPLSEFSLLVNKVLTSYFKRRFKLSPSSAGEESKGLCRILRIKNGYRKQKSLHGVPVYPAEFTRTKKKSVLLRGPPIFHFYPLPCR